MAAWSASTAALERISVGAGLVVSLGGADTLLEHVRPSALLGAGLLELGDVAVEIGPGPIELGLERPRIDREERVAGLNVLPFAEVDLGHLAADFRLDRNRRVGLHGADFVELRRHRFLHGDRGYHRHRFFAEGLDRCRRASIPRATRSREEPIAASALKRNADNGNDSTDRGTGTPLRPKLF